MLNRGDYFIYFVLNEDQEYVYIVKVNIKDICIVKTTEKLNNMEHCLCLPNKSLSSRDNWKKDAAINWKISIKKLFCRKFLVFCHRLRIIFQFEMLAVIRKNRNKYFLLLYQVFIYSPMTGNNLYADFIFIFRTKLFLIFIHYKSERFIDIYSLS